MTVLTIHSVRFRTGFLHAVKISERPRPAREAEMCPKAKQSTSEWAKEALDFQPDPKRAEVLDCPGRRLILNCSRQWASPPWSP